MKKALVFAICAIVIGVGLFAACGQDSKPVSLKSSVIRLHILANSDSDADQDMKLRVRDMVLEKWGMRLSSADGPDESWNTLQSLLPDIRKDIEDLLGSSNAGYGVSLDTGVYEFPDKDYGGVAFPAGSYRALKVELGDAAGHNWWCVMFPPLCLIGENGEMSIEEYKELVKSLDEEGLMPEEAPETPVRSWLFDQLFGGKQWDKDFLKWAMEFWLGGDEK